MTDYRIVPVEPTTGMCCAALDANRELSDEYRPLRVGYELVDAPVIYAAMLSAAPAVDRQAVVETIKLNPAFMAEVMDEQQDWLAGVLADAILALFGEGE